LLTEMTLPKIENVSTDGNYGKYHVEPLDPGFGVTLGNAVRRVLMSSLPGAAVTSIKIEGAFHEFSALPGVKEDTTELILNLKQLRLRSFSDRPVTLRIEARGTGEVLAADIIAPPDIEIVNPELHLAQLDGEDASLVIEMVAERGKGYIPAEQRDGSAIGVIPVDAVFTPTRRVNYAVEPVRVGSATDFERLVLEVWTDGTTSPDDAVAQSAQILIRHFELLTELVAQPTARFEKQAVPAHTISQKLFDVPIEDLELTVRAYNCLKRAGLTKVGQVLEMTEDDLLGVRNFGKKSLDELVERLAERGFLENSRFAGSLATSVVAPEGQAWPDESADEESEPGAAAESVDASPRFDTVRPRPLTVSDDEELEDFTRSPSAARRGAPRYRPTPAPAVAVEEEDVSPDYDAHTFEEFEDEEAEDEPEGRPPRVSRRR